MGQSKKSRHWRFNNGPETNSTNDQTLCTGRDSVQDPTLIFPLEQEENTKSTGNIYPQTLTISSSHINRKSILSSLLKKITYHCPNQRQSVKIVSTSLPESGINNEENTNSKKSGEKNVQKNRRQSRREKILTKLTDTKMLQNLIKKT